MAVGKRLAHWVYERAPKRVRDSLRGSEFVVSMYRRLFVDHGRIDSALMEMPAELSGEAELVDGSAFGLAGFNLIGENWQDSAGSHRIAILCNTEPDLQTYITRYLNEYRVAVPARSGNWRTQKRSLNRQSGLTFVFWDVQESPRMRKYAQERKAPVFLLKEGFIGSIPLKDEIRLPLSALSIKIAPDGAMVGLAELVTLLNEYDFPSDRKLMAAVPPLIKLFRDLDVGAGGRAFGSIAPTEQGVKLRPRILVAGELRGDVTEYGEAAGGLNWSQLIDLAVVENPDADIVILPGVRRVETPYFDPAKHSKSGIRLQVLQNDRLPRKFLDQFDRIYTLGSLIGLEALVRGVRVSVAGTPFYAGWGLTDDRVPIVSRRRKLSLEEFFCGVYLLYPQYLPNFEDPVIGCLGAVFRFVAERRRTQDAKLLQPELGSLAEVISESDYWPVLLKNRYQTELEGRYGKRFMSVVSITYVFSRCHGECYQSAMAYFLAGALHGRVAFWRFLSDLKSKVRPRVFGSLLVDIWKIGPSRQLLDQWAAHQERSGAVEDAKEALKCLAFGEVSVNGQIAALPYPKDRLPHILKYAQFRLRMRDLTEATQLFHNLLLSGYAQAQVFIGLAQIATLRFDFVSAASILKVCNHFESGWRLGRAYPAEANAQACVGDSSGALESLSIGALYSPQFIEALHNFAEVSSREIGILPYAEAMQAAVEMRYDGGAIGRAKALIANKRSNEAERVLASFCPGKDDFVEYCLVLSRAYSFQGKLDDARRLISALLVQNPSLLVFREALRLSVMLNDYEWGRTLLDLALANDVDVGELYIRKVAFGSGRIKDAYLSFRAMTRLSIMRAYFGERYVQTLEAIGKKSSEENIILAFFGPGDEIRFASFYQEMHQSCGDARTRITCDPRLLPLLKRHYGDMEFVPVRRARSLVGRADYSDLDGLPGSDLHPYFDNTGWDVAKAADRVILVTDALGDVIDGYESFKGTAYLKADSGRIDRWRERLQRVAEGFALVGLSWRSSLTTYSRDEHYLAAEDLAPLFDVPGVRYVNLQYDDCSDELAWIEERYPGRIVNFDDLDQFNDLDGVAALMCCLDLVVAPATTVVELAGALGCPTLLLSNSSELHWRKRPGTMIDVWHRSVTHVEGEVLGDKSMLVTALKRHLTKEFGLGDNGVPGGDGTSASVDVEVV